MTPATAHQDYELNPYSKRPQPLTSSYSLDQYFRKHLREESPREWVQDWRLEDAWAYGGFGMLDTDA